MVFRKSCGYLSKQPTKYMRKFYPRYHSSSISFILCVPHPIEGLVIEGLPLVANTDCESICSISTLGHM